MRMRRPVIASSFQVLFATASLDLDRSRWAAVIDEYLAHPKLSVTDIYLTALAHSTGATPLYTFRQEARSTAEWRRTRLIERITRL